MFIAVNIVLNRYEYEQIDDDFVKYLRYCRDRCFGNPLPDNIIEEMSSKKYATKSYRNMKWVLAMYCAWKWQHNRLGTFEPITVDLDDVTLVTKEELVFALSRFICETRKKDGSEFPPKTLKHIILIIQMYLNSKGHVYEFLDDPEFHKLAMCVDNKMKENAKMGLGCTVRKAEPLDSKQVQQLWKSGVLGDDDPKKMSKTLLFLLGVNLALRAGWEHKSLRRPGCDPQITLVDEGGDECLLYCEDLSTKTNQGGLKHQQIDGKSVLVHPADDPQRCPVVYYKKYIAMLPKTFKFKELYLQANSKKRINAGENAFKDRPVGINTLSSTMKELAKEANLEGFITNHSLRASSATDLYNDDANIPEQVIAETTGHRSNAIRGYKCTKKGLKHKVSNILTKLSSGKSDVTSGLSGTFEGPLDLSVKRNCNMGLASTTSTADHIQNVKLDITVSLKK